MTDDERVRALLADLGAGHESEPLPDEVAVRLEETIAALVAERAASQTSEEHTATGTVVPLRPRWLPRAAAAAAAVVVLAGGGAAVAGFLHHPADTASSASTSSTSREQPAAGGDAASGRAAQPGAGSTAAPAPAARSGAAPSTATPHLTTAGYAADVRALLARRPALHGHADGATASCPGPADLGDASTAPVVLDGTPALLVVRPPVGGSRAVEVWSCSGGHRLATTRVAP